MLGNKLDNILTRPVHWLDIWSVWYLNLFDKAGAWGGGPGEESGLALQEEQPGIQVQVLFTQLLLFDCNTDFNFKNT